MKGIVIETTNLREGGSRHEIDGTVYHFKPNTAGHHVCMFTNPKHAKRFLSIDGFQPYLDGEDEEDVIDDDEVDLIEPEVDEEDEDIDEDGGEADGDEAGEKTGPAAPALDLTALDDEELAKLHVEHVGRPPHPNAKRETIEAKIKEAIEGQAPAA